MSTVRRAQQAGPPETALVRQGGLRLTRFLAVGLLAPGFSGARNRLQPEGSVGA